MRADVSSLYRIYWIDLKFKRAKLSCLFSSPFAISLRRNFIYFAWMGEADPCERFPGNREDPRGISQTNFRTYQTVLRRSNDASSFNLWLDRLCWIENSALKGERDSTLSA